MSERLSIWVSGRLFEVEFADKRERDSFISKASLGSRGFVAVKTFGGGESYIRPSSVDMYERRYP